MSDVEIARDASAVLPALDDSALLSAMDKSTVDDSGVFGDATRPELVFNDDFGAEALAIDTGLEMPPSPSSNSLDISAGDLNSSIANSRASLDFALGAGVDSEIAAGGADGGARPRKKRRIGRDSVTELSSAELKKVRTDT